MILELPLYQFYLSLNSQTQCYYSQGCRNPPFIQLMFISHKKILHCFSYGKMTKLKLKVLHFRMNRRNNIMPLACRHGQMDCLLNSTRLFEEWLQDEESVMFKSFFQHFLAFLKKVQHCSSVGQTI